MNRLRSKRQISQRRRDSFDRETASGGGAAALHRPMEEGKLPEEAEKPEQRDLIEEKPTGPPTYGLLSWQNLRERVDARYHMKLTENDPMQMIAYLFQAVVESSWDAMIEAQRIEIKRGIARYGRALEEIGKQRQREFEIQAAEFASSMRTHLKLELDHGETALQSNIGELRELTEDLKSGTAGRKWSFILLGLIVSALLVGAGVLIGRYA